MYLKLYNNYLHYYFGLNEFQKRTRKIIEYRINIEHSSSSPHSHARSSFLETTNATNGTYSFLVAVLFAVRDHFLKVPCHLVKIECF